MKRKTYAVISWIGLGLVLLAVFPSPCIILGFAYDIGEVLLPFLVIVFVALITAICGIFARSLKIWNAMVAVGFIWMVLPALGAWAGLDYYGFGFVFGRWLLLNIPGLILAASGIALRLRYEWKFGEINYRY